MSKTGIALVIVKEAAGLIWPQIIEITDEKNLLDVKYRPIIFYPDVETIADLIDQKLLFRYPAPQEWYSLRDLPRKENPGVSELTIWEPQIPAPVLPAAEVLFHNAGHYKGGYGDYNVIILEYTNCEVRFKDQKTLLGGRTPPDIAFERLDTDLETLLHTVWQRF